MGKRMKHKILPFRSIRLNVPRRSLIRLFHSEHSLTTKELVNLRTKLREIEQVENKVRHVRNLVERLLLRRNSPI